MGCSHSHRDIRPHQAQKKQSITSSSAMIPIQSKAASLSNKLTAKTQSTKQQNKPIIQPPQAETKPIQILPHRIYGIGEAPMFDPYSSRQILHVQKKQA